MAWTEQGSLKGPKGDTGAASTVPGPKGDTGAPGAASTVPGPKGDTGAPGTNGTNGATGVTGPRGSKWFFGTAAPGTVSGAVIGDCYLNTTTGVVSVLA